MSAAQQWSACDECQLDDGVVADSCIVQHLAVMTAWACAQSKGRQPVRIVNVSSKMHELAGGVDVDDPHFEARGAFSSLAAYNRSKLCQARLPPAERPAT